MTENTKLSLPTFSPSLPRQLRRLMHLRTVTGKGGGPEKTLLQSPPRGCVQNELWTAIASEFERLLFDRGQTGIDQT